MHGCPAYVSPEILRTNTRYSGRAADMWGLGVMLYTMLVGRYPFHGAEHSGLFAKIRRGHFSKEFKKILIKRFIIPSFIGSFCLNNILEYFHSKLKIYLIKLNSYSL